MSSPFKTHQEFLEAKGPIYTFGNNPTVISILLVVSALVLLWFIYASYTIKKSKSNAKNPVILSLLIATSSFALAESFYTSHVKKTSNTTSRKEEVPQRVVSSKQGQGWQVPMAAVGTMLASGSVIQRRRRKKSGHSLQNGKLTWRISQEIRIWLSSILGSTQPPVGRRSKRRFL